MSSTPPYLKKMTPTFVKTKERADVDINRLVKHGAGRISVPAPTYADLTEIPASRGEAAALISQIRLSYPELIPALLRLPPQEAYKALEQLQAQASNANDQTNAKEQALEKPQTKKEEPPK